MPVDSASASHRRSHWRDGGFVALIFAVAFAVYFPALRGELVWDDEWWTTGIEHLLRDFSGLRMMWSSPLTGLQQYYPITGTTFWVDYHLWGSWLLAYHAENVLLIFCALCCRCGNEATPSGVENRTVERTIWETEDRTPF